MHGRCVEKLEVSSAEGAAYPQLSLLALGAVFTSQSSSLRALRLDVDLADITGADAAILVSCK